MKQVSLLRRLARANQLTSNQNTVQLQNSNGAQTRKFNVTSRNCNQVVSGTSSNNTSDPKKTQQNMSVEQTLQLVFNQLNE